MASERVWERRHLFRYIKDRGAELESVSFFFLFSGNEMGGRVYDVCVCVRERGEKKSIRSAGDGRKTPAYAIKAN